MKFDFDGLPKDTKISRFEYSAFQTTAICETCKWFCRPADFSEDCCPDCGNRNLRHVVGRYKREIVFRGKFFKKICPVNYIVGFEPKIDG